jgi:metal-sulfur cluster biosynthetic enzyme
VLIDFREGFLPSPNQATILDMNDISTPSEPTKEQVIEVLKTVEDPELFLDIWFLGLIYNIAIDEGRVIIDMTFTSPMCPAGPQLKHEVQTKVAALPGVKEAIVQITFTPPWEASEEVKGMLGML